MSDEDCVEREKQMHEAEFTQSSYLSPQSVFLTLHLRRAS
jgi:hypothetical protein